MFPTQLVVLLLITALSAIGILAIAVAQSRLPRSIQPAALLLPLLPLWTAKAPDAVLVLLIESLVVYTTVRRRHQARPDSSPSPLISGQPGNAADADQRFRFRVSLLVVFECLSLAAVVLALATQIADWPWTAWVTIVDIGTCSGIAVLSGWWMTVPTGKWTRRLPANLAITLASATLLAFGDQFLDNDTWPPLSASLSWSSPNPAWWLIIPMISAVVAAWCRLTRTAKSPATSTLAPTPVPNAPVTSSPANRLITLSMTLALIFLIFGPPLTTLIWLNLPSQRLPNDPVLVDNYRRALELARSISSSTASPLIYEWETASLAQVESTLAIVGDDIVAARQAIGLPGEVPLDETRDLLDTGLMRDLTRAFMLDGRQALSRQAPDEACQSFLDGVRTGFFTRTRGLLVDGLIGIACTFTGAEMIYRHRHEFSTTTLRSTWTELERHLESREPVERFIERDRRWIWPQTSWTERVQMLEETILAQPLFGESTFYGAWQRESARLQLLATELALIAYHREHGSWPDTLAQLVPAYLHRVPADPWSSTEEPLRYRVLPAGYSLYSIGPDRVDDGGHLPDLSQDPFDEDSGDVSLEREFPPPSPPYSAVKEFVPVEPAPTPSLEPDVGPDAQQITP